MAKVSGLKRLVYNHVSHSIRFHRGQGKVSGLKMLVYNRISHDIVSLFYMIEGLGHWKSFWPKKLVCCSQILSFYIFWHQGTLCDLLLFFISV